MSWNKPFGSDIDSTNLNKVLILPVSADQFYHTVLKGNGVLNLAKLRRSAIQPLKLRRRFTPFYLKHWMTQTAVVWSCLPFIRSGQNHLARHCERGKKTRQTEEEVGRQHQGMDRPGVRQVPEGSG